MKIFKRPYAILFVCLLFIILSCNEEEPIPAYIKINSIDLLTDQNTEGWNTHAIKDAWVYIDNELAGAYELPAEFPVLFEGTHNIAIGPGIFLNGISGTRTEYPFYKFYNTIETLSPIQSVTLNPTVTYFPNINFKWIEDFEGAGFTLINTVFSDTSIIQITKPDTNVEYGDKAGYFALDTTRNFFEVKSDDSFVLPTNNTPVFIELDYKCTIPFTVGIFANQFSQIDQEPIVVINPKDDWNKIYIELAFTLNKYPAANDFDIFIGTFLQQGTDFGEVYIDNIKLIHSN